MPAYDATSIGATSHTQSRLLFFGDQFLRANTYAKMPAQTYKGRIPKAIKKNCMVTSLLAAMAREIQFSRFSKSLHLVVV